MRLTVAAAVLLVASQAGAPPRLEAGEWENRNWITPLKGATVERTDRTCYTPSDASIYASRDAWVAGMIAEPGSESCEPKNPKREGTAFSVTLECPDLARSELRHDFRGVTGTIDVEHWQDDQRTVKIHSELRRVGDRCSAEAIEQWKLDHPGRAFEP